jgi:hypothetical protein
VGYFKLITLGKAKFVNVRDVQISTWANASAIVENSTVTWCLNMRGMKDYVLLKDSIITRGEACFMDGRYAAGTVMSGGDIHYVEFENTTIDAPLYICTTYTYIKGDLTFLVREANYVWGTVEREYSVDVKDENNEPEENATVGLFDSYDNCTLKEASDAQGRISFNLTFTQHNYTDTLKLKISKEGFYNSTRDIGFFSDTPVSIFLIERLRSDLNQDHTVNILDISIVAKAYGSKPGDINWNEAADLDKNGVINIVDVAMAARDYGKTAWLLPLILV